MNPDGVLPNLLIIRTYLNEEGTHIMRNKFLYNIFTIIIIIVSDSTTMVLNLARVINIRDA